MEEAPTSQRDVLLVPSTSEGIVSFLGPLLAPELFPVARRSNQNVTQGHVIWVGQPPQASCPHSRDAKLCVAILGPRVTRVFLFLPSPPLWKKKDKKSEQPTGHQGRILEVPHYLECSRILQVASSAQRMAYRMLYRMWFCTMGDLEEDFLRFSRNFSPLHSFPNTCLPTAH